jgi:hypothetical protein
MALFALQMSSEKATVRIQAVTRDGGILHNIKIRTPRVTAFFHSGLAPPRAAFSVVS